MVETHRVPGDDIGVHDVPVFLDPLGQAVRPFAAHNVNARGVALAGFVGSDPEIVLREACALLRPLAGGQQAECRFPQA